MDVQPTLTHNLRQLILDLCKNDDLFDFAVVVDGTSFQCHRNILSACSSFFQGLFRSQMKECQDNQVKVQGMTASTFDVILNSVYKGVDGLTVDNVLDVWSATEQLQIRYLSEECENFVIENVSVDNCFSILWHARLYSAEKVVTHALEVMTKHFEQVRNMENFLALPFADFYRVIESEFLVAGTEDLVVKTVFKWVDYTQHNIPNMTQDNKFPYESCGNNTSYTKENKNSENETDHVNKNKNSENETDHDNENKNSENETDHVNENKNSENETDHANENETDHIKENKSRISNYDWSTLPGREICQAVSLSESIKNSVKLHSAEIVPKHCRKVYHNVNLLDVQNEREDRKQHLCTLISKCRLYLVCFQCLNYLHHTLSCENALNLVSDVLTYQTSVGLRHEAWPEAVIHRVASHMKHVMVFMSNNKFWAYNLISGSVQEFADLPEDFQSSPSIVVFDNTLYLIYLNNKECTTLSKFTANKTWEFVNHMQTGCFDNFLVRDYHIYRLLDGILCYCNCVYGISRDWEYCSSFSTHGDIMVAFQNYVLIFRTETSVYALCCAENGNTHTSPSSMRGTSVGMISFTHLGDVFLLQRNGSLWKICSTGTDPVDFELVSKLWDENIDLKGSVVYRKELFVFYRESSPPIETHLSPVPDLFRNIKLVAIDSGSLCRPMILPEKWLQP